MPIFEAESYVDAPFEEVWDFHSGVDGLVALTPGWMGMGVESVEGPEGEANPEVLDEGSRIDISLKIFGIMPRVSWTSVILERESEEKKARFVDEMSDGPFKKWVHTHSFEAEEGGTIVNDRVEYELPIWMLGRLGSPFFKLNARFMFRHRHKKTREILEQG